MIIIRYLYKIVLFLCLFGFGSTLNAQSFNEKYQSFKKNADSEYYSFRKECNKKYIQFLKDGWSWFTGDAPLPLPLDQSPIPPRPYNGDKVAPTHITPIIENEPLTPEPQPTPIEPIREKQGNEEDYFIFDFYGVSGKIRISDRIKFSLNDCTPESISNGWKLLSEDGMNNTIRDCLEARIRFNLCDYAYLLFLYEFSKQFYKDSNSAMLLTAFLFCQSGYQMRLGVDKEKLVLLYGSLHQIFEKGFFNIDGINFYPLFESSNSIKICNMPFEGEKPLSLIIDREMLLGQELSETRRIMSEGYKDVVADSKVPIQLIKFYNSYPTPIIAGNQMTRWAVYANTPFAKAAKESIYPALRNKIAGLSECEAVNRLLNWVQTGFAYEYDDKIWGHDRAFFAEESLYYPYCDCEDRSILFSRLVRDILGLDVALVFYPGHLATAVCFNENVKGDAVIINDRKFIICDPTYIGAPVGVQMPELDYNKTQVIILQK